MRLQNANSYITLGRLLLVITLTKPVANRVTNNLKKQKLNENIVVQIDNESIMKT